MCSSGVMESIFETHLLTTEFFKSSKVSDAWLTVSLDESSYSKILKYLSGKNKLPLVVSHQHADKTKFLQDEVNFCCASEDKAQWFKDEELLQSDDRVAIKQREGITEVCIRDLTVEDSGVYTCNHRIYDKQHLVVTEVYTLQVQNFSRPRDVQCNRVNSETVTVTWGKALGAEGYKVYYMPADDPKERNVLTCSEDERSVPLKNLMPNTKYRIYVVSTKGDLESDKSPAGGKVIQTTDLKGKRPAKEQAGHPQKRRRFDYEEWTTWKIEDVCNFLADNGLNEAIAAFRDKEISGLALPNLTEEILDKKMQIESLDLRQRIMKTMYQQLYRLYTSPTYNLIYDRYKVFNDPVHGHLEIHPLCVKIIDTPQFQRLRYIKQLGGCYFIFPGASHNRFEHSLGVAWLANRYIQILRGKQPELRITEEDTLCVTIAGLCHDLGRGPFSNVFDDSFISKVRRGCNWTHEKASEEMFEHLFKEGNFEQEFTRYGLYEDDIIFIRELISGSPSKSPKKISESNLDERWPYKGRGKGKSFLYEIISNKRSGTDVKTWDSLARDCHHLGIKNNFDHQRFMKFALVLEAEGELQICTRDKEALDLYDMFLACIMLQRKAYKHKTTTIVELMITEALLKADAHVRFKGNHGKEWKISETIDDMVAYAQLDDTVFLTILRSSGRELQEARNILDMIQNRRLYKCIGELHPTATDFKITEEKVFEWKAEILDKCEPFSIKGEKQAVKPEDLELEVIDMEFGMDSKNPISNMLFYYKGKPENPEPVKKEQVSRMLPAEFRDQHLRVYCKRLDPECVKAAREAYHKWSKIQDELSTQDSKVFLNLDHGGREGTIEISVPTGYKITASSSKKI